MSTQMFATSVVLKFVLQCLLHCLWLQFVHKSIWDSLQPTSPTTNQHHMRPHPNILIPVHPSHRKETLLCNNHKLQPRNIREQTQERETQGRAISLSLCNNGSWEIRSGLICWFNFHHFHNNLWPTGTVIPAIFNTMFHPSLISWLEQGARLGFESPSGHWGCWLYMWQ